MAITIQKPVGLKCRNERGDVFLDQFLLNKFLMAGCLPPLPPLMLDGKCGNKTVTAIFAFQNGILGWKHPDMKIAPGGKTLAALNGPLKWYKPKPPGDGGVTYLDTPKAPEEPFGDPVMVTAICAKSHEDWGKRARYGKVVFAIDAWTMVLNTEKAIGDSPIDRLHVLTHAYFKDGTGQYIEGIFFPNLEVRADNQSEWEMPLLRLRPLFHDRGDTVFYGCWSGLNVPLLRKLAATLQVPVYAPTEQTLMSTGYSYGSWRCADPNGSSRMATPPHKPGSGF